MSKALQDLYYGNNLPSERFMSAGSPMRRLSARLSQCESELREQLNEGEKEQLDDLVHAQQEMDSMTAEENFIRGFRLGVQLMVECLIEGGEN